MPVVFTPLTVVTMLRVIFGPISVPEKGIVAFPASLLTETLAGAQVSVDPVATVIDGVTMKLAPDGAEHE